MPKNHQEHVSSGSEWQPERHRLTSDVIPRTERSQVPRTERSQVPRMERDAVPRYIPHDLLSEDLASYEDAQRSSRHTSDHPYGIHYALESSSLRRNSRIAARQSLDMNVPTFDDTDISHYRRAYSKEYTGGLRIIAERLLWQWLPIRYEGAGFNIFAYFGIRVCANTSTQSSDQGRGSHRNTTSYSPGWVTGPQRSVSKRVANDSDEEGRDEGSGSRRKQRAKLNTDGKYWACPYWKHDPLKYSLRNDSKCATYLLDSIPRLK
jgi:hypothetical protein